MKGVWIGIAMTSQKAGSLHQLPGRPCCILPAVHDQRRAVTAFGGLVCGLALASAVFARHIRWLFILLLVLAFLAIVVVVVSGAPDVVGWLRSYRTSSTIKARVPEPVFTERWRNTTEGMEVPSLMMTLQKELNHPGYMGSASGQRPSIRIGVLVAASTLGDIPTTSELAGAFLAFLREPPIWDLINRLTHVGPDLSWHSYDSNGRIKNGAVLTVSNDQTEAPVASVLMNLREAGTQSYGPAPGCAEMALRIQPQDATGGLAGPFSLGEWRDLLVLALAIPGAFASFLARQVGLVTSGETRELIDPGPFEKVAGSVMSRSFTSYLIAEQGGVPPSQVSLDVLRVWCDRALHIHG